MVQQIARETLLGTHFQVIPNGMSLDTRLDSTVMKQSISETINAFIDLLLIDIASLAEGEYINIIFPMDGSFLPMYEYIRTLAARNISPEIIAKTHPIFSAKTSTPSMKKTYLLSVNPKPNSKTYILDDIYDQGESSQLIKERGQINDEDFNVISLSTKEGRNYQQPAPLYLYEDKWIASGFGMNSGQFGQKAIMEEGTFETEEERDFMLRVHLDIEIYERMCGVSFLIEDLHSVDSWRFDGNEALKYLNLLKTNCLYTEDEQAYLFSFLASIQSRETAAEKFEVLGHKDDSSQGKIVKKRREVKEG